MALEGRKKDNKDCTCEFYSWGGAFNLKKANLACSVRGHSGAVKTEAWSIDGKMLTSGGMDCTFILWDAEQERRLMELKGR